MAQLGEILLSEKMITREQLDAALELQRTTGRMLGRVLVDQNVLTEGQLVSALATQIGLPFVDLSDMVIDGSAVGRLPGPVCRRHHVLPIGIENGFLILAMADPANVVARDDVRSLTGMEVRVVVATRHDVDAAIDRAYRADSDLDDLSLAMDVEEDEDGLDALHQVVEDAPIVKFVNLLITQGIQDGASDIHLEPNEHDLLVRFRIDGVLHEMMRSPRNIHNGVVSRLKIMAEMNIAERRIPQDGRLSVAAHGKKVDLRIATLPTVWGEKVVMRILDNSTAQLDLSVLGFSPENYSRYAESFSKPYGMILVTGPTGSGKSTTLYATLNIINRPEVNIITVEDPVEYRLAGVSQIQTNPRAGLTFASALRSILRSDPDIVLIGEIRDHETAQIAIEASLTGHLVLTTLHTNDAPSAVTRLAEMGIEPFLVGSALDCVLAQRLARRLCSSCRDEYKPTPETLMAARFPWDPSGPVPVLYRAEGVREVRRNRLPGPGRAARGDADERDPGTHGRRARHHGRDHLRGPRRRHAGTAPGRHGQGARGSDLVGRGPARGPVAGQRRGRLKHPAHRADGLKSLHGGAMSATSPPTGPAAPPPDRPAEPAPAWPVPPAGTAPPLPPEARPTGPDAPERGEQQRPTGRDSASRPPRRHSPAPHRPFPNRPPPPRWPRNLRCLARLHRRKPHRDRGRHSHPLLRHPRGPDLRHRPQRPGFPNPRPAHPNQRLIRRSRSPLPRSPDSRPRSRPPHQRRSPTRTVAMDRHPAAVRPRCRPRP